MSDRIALPPAVLCDCGHSDNDPREHDESGRKTGCKLCRACSEMRMSRAMRLELSNANNRTEAGD
jgi:hypothetical protein